MILLLPGKQSSFVAGGVLNLEPKLNTDNWKKIEKCLQVLDGETELLLPIIAQNSLVELSESLMNVGM